MKYYDSIIEDITSRKRAEEELPKGFRKLQRIMEGTIKAMARVVETMDLYTDGHQRRVANIACAIAKEMCLSKEQISGIYMAAVIHDVGKVYVPAEILGVADVVEAPGSQRPYRTAPSKDKILDELLQNKGTLYDPTVVDAWLKLFPEKKFNLE